MGCTASKRDPGNVQATGRKSQKKQTPKTEPRTGQHVAAPRNANPIPQPNEIPLTHPVPPPQEVQLTMYEPKRGYVKSVPVRLVKEASGPVVVGVGSSGTVYLGEITESTSTQKIVLKCGDATQGGGQTNDVFQELKREEDIWKVLTGDHDHILSFLGSGFGRIDGSFGNLFYLASPYMEHTDLVAYIQILVEKKQDCDRPKYLWQIAGALNYVHEKGVVYGDMKAQNILISGQDRAYLCDFGSAYMESSPAESHPPANCTFRNMAPELFGNPREKKPKSTKASDVYSFGMTIYEVLSGKDPLFKYNAMDKLGEAVIKGERPPLEPSTSSGGRSYDRLWAVATDCWKGDPNSRPLMKDVYARMKDDPPKLQPGGSSKPKRQ